MNTLQEPFLFALDRWWQISLTVLGCVLSIRLAYYFGLNRPWPLPVILGGIQAHMIMEAYPYAWTLGPHEFFVVGDNLAVSEDSRTWKRAGLPRGAMVGRPLRWAW